MNIFSRRLPVFLLPWRLTFGSCRRVTFAAGGSVPLLQANNDVSNTSSLQRGARELRELLHGLSLGEVRPLQPARRAI